MCRSIACGGRRCPSQQAGARRGGAERWLRSGPRNRAAEDRARGIARRVSALPELSQRDLSRLRQVEPVVAIRERLESDVRVAGAARRAGQPAAVPTSPTSTPTPAPEPVAPSTPVGDDDATWAEHPDLAAYREAGVTTVADAEQWHASLWTPSRVRGWVERGVDCATANTYREQGVRSAAALGHGSTATSAALAAAYRGHPMSGDESVIANPAEPIEEV